VTGERSRELGAVLGMYEREFPRGQRETRASVRRWLHAKAAGRLEPNDYHILVATARGDGRVAAFAFFHYLADINSGFLGYMAVRRTLRNHGIGRWLFGQVKLRLGEDATQRGFGVPEGVFMELEVEDATPEVDARLRFWQRVDALPLRLQWQYPRLQRGAAPAEMYLAFCPMRGAGRRIPAERVRRAVVSIYRHVYGKGADDPNLFHVLDSIGTVAYVGRAHRGR